MVVGAIKNPRIGQMMDPNTPANQLVISHKYTIVSRGRISAPATMKQGILGGVVVSGVERKGAWRQIAVPPDETAESR